MGPQGSEGLYMLGVCVWLRNVSVEGDAWLLSTTLCDVAVGTGCCNEAVQKSGASHGMYVLLS